MTTHRPVLCSRCRAMVLIPEALDLVPPGWVRRDDLKLFCGPPCVEQGEALPVRERIEAFIRFAPGQHPLRLVGIADAIDGFDCLSTDPHYVGGHAAGMASRPVFEQARKALAGQVGE